MKGWRVGLIVNMKQNVKVDLDAPPDALAEFDTPVTVNAKGVRSIWSETMLKIVIAFAMSGVRVASRIHTIWARYWGGQRNNVRTINTKPIVIRVYVYAE